MSTTQRYTLGKAERMKSRKAIDEVFDKGKAFSVFPLRVIYVVGGEGNKAEEVNKVEKVNRVEKVNKAGLQCGFTTSAKRFKKATDRNRIKRVMRECWRLQKNGLAIAVAEQKMQLDVFLIYVGNELPEYEEVFTKTAAAIKRLIKIINENSKAGT